MSYIPDCRTDEYYNENKLDKRDKEFIAGYDFAVEQIINLFSNLELYPNVYAILSDNVAIIKDGKAKAVEEAIKDWAEMERNTIITSMLDYTLENK